MLRSFLFFTLIMLSFAMPARADDLQNQKEYDTLWQAMIREKSLTFSDTKGTDSFVKRVTKMIQLLDIPEDISAYANEIMGQLQVILKAGAKLSTKVMVEEALGGLEELIAAYKENYKGQRDAGKFEQLCGVLKSTLSNLSSQCVGGTTHSEYEDLYSGLVKEQLLSFADKKKSMAFINNLNKLIAKADIPNEARTFFKQKITQELSGIINTGLSSRTKDVVYTALKRLEAAITAFGKTYYESAISQICMLMQAVKVHLNMECMDKKLDENVGRVASSGPTKVDTTMKDATAYIEFVKSDNERSYKAFFDKTKQSDALCALDPKKPFNAQFDVVWPCKTKYIEPLVKQYHAEIYPQFKQLQNGAQQLSLFVKNKARYDDATKKAKIDELSKTLDGLKKTEKVTLWNKFKAALPGKKKSIKKMVDELKNTLIRDMTQVIKDNSKV